MGRRAVIIVLDGVGAGGAPDAAEFGDEGANTLGNTARAVGSLELPHLRSLGLGNVAEIKGVPPVAAPEASYGLMQEHSAAKATLAGHWEMMGIVLEDPLPTYPDGFPPEIISRFEEETGRRVIGNRPASGTEIIEELGPEQEATGAWIVYTSADSVFQIAAHTGMIPLEELYEACEKAHGMLIGERQNPRRARHRPALSRRAGRLRKGEREPPRLRHHSPARYLSRPHRSSRSRGRRGRQGTGRLRRQGHHAAPPRQPRRRGEGRRRTRSPRASRIWSDLRQPRGLRREVRPPPRPERHG